MSWTQRTRMSGCAAVGQKETEEFKWWFLIVDYGDSLNQITTQSALMLSVKTSFID